MKEEMKTFLAPLTREAKEITLCLRNLVLDAFQDAIEIISLKSGIIAYGFDKTCKEFVCAIAPYPKHVNLMFSRGTEIPDPAGLLAGAGKHARHVKIKSEAQTQNPILRLLLDNAIRIGRMQRLSGKGKSKE
jgi:hypothetical protein